MNDIRTILAETITAVLADRGVRVAAIEDEDTLVGTLGLESLDLAVVVVKLERRLGGDPFRNGRAPVPTFGELVAVYQELV